MQQTAEAAFLCQLRCQVESIFPPTDNVYVSAIHKPKLLPNKCPSWVDWAIDHSLHSVFFSGPGVGINISPPTRFWTCCPGVSTVAEDALVLLRTVHLVTVAFGTPCKCK